MHRRCSTSLLLSLGMLLLPVAARPQVPDASPAPAVAGAAPDAPAARLSALEAENAALRTALAQLEDSRARLAVLEQRLAALQAQAAGPSAGAPPATAGLEDRLSRLEAENVALREALSKAAPRPSSSSPSSLSLFGGARVRVVGYLDAGFFKGAGDGTAYVRDMGKVLHPEFADVPWVFLGDPWANPINSQGDSADLGLDRSNLQRFDPIHSGGRSSFLVNMANLGLVGSVKDNVLFETSIGFEPRSGRLGSSGDQIDVDLAYLEWIPLKNRDLHVFVGKFESTFGIEYPHRKAPDRFGITPSLIQRYTSGNPTGLKVRAATRDARWTFNLALTNGNMTTEKFAHFFDEIATNSGKTASGRVAFKLPLPFTLELGASGVYGAKGPDAADPYRQFGFDALLRSGDLTVRAEWLKAESNRHRVPDVPWLHAKGGYVEASYQALPWVGAYLRADFRDALLRADTNLYITDDARGTAGLRFDLSPNVIGKVEYLHIKERRGPELNDDVFTSSLIFKF